MGLSKRISLGNGVTVNYHRVVSVNCIVNLQNVVEVASYTSKSKRAEEQAAIAAEEPMDIYMEAAYYEAPYDQSMTVDSAYEWLKGLPEFEGATDVLEEVAS